MEKNWVKLKAYGDRREAEQAKMTLLENAIRSRFRFRHEEDELALMVKSENYEEAIEILEIPEFGPGV